MNSGLSIDHDTKMAVSLSPIMYWGLTTTYALGFNYHILPVFSFDIWLQWDRHQCYSSIDLCSFKICLVFSVFLFIIFSFSTFTLLHRCWRSVGHLFSVTCNWKQRFIFNHLQSSVVCLLSHNKHYALLTWWQFKRLFYALTWWQFKRLFLSLIFKC